MSPPVPEPSPLKRVPLRLGVFLAVIFLMIVTMPTLLHRCTFKPVQETVESARDTALAVSETARAIRSILQVEPEVHYQSKVIQNQVSPIAELAMAEREMEVKFFWSQEWLKSKKSIELAASYRVKAGFDLEQAVRVEYSSHPREVIDVVLPRAEILSVERFGDIHYQDESGWWNRIGDADRQAALKAIDDEARRLAGESSLLSEAEEMTRQRLTDMLKDLGVELEIAFGQPGPPEGENSERPMDSFSP